MFLSGVERVQNRCGVGHPIDSMAISTSGGLFAGYSQIIYPQNSYFHLLRQDPKNYLLFCLSHWKPISQVHKDRSQYISFIFSFSCNSAGKDVNIFRAPLSDCWTVGLSLLPAVESMRYLPCIVWLYCCIPVPRALSLAGT